MTDEEIQALQGELESTKAELETLKAEKETFAGELALLKEGLENKEAAITELESVLQEKDKVIASKDNDITTLKQAIAKSEEVLTNVKDSLAQAVASYRALVVQANPGVVEELITGDSIEAIDHSLENARSLISRVKQGLEAEAFKTRVPAGAPQRTPLDLSALSPREKIQYAIGGKR